MDLCQPTCGRPHGRLCIETWERWENLYRAEAAALTGGCVLKRQVYQAHNRESPGRPHGRL